jgi:hypothetical protein
MICVNNLKGNNSYIISLYCFVILVFNTTFNSISVISWRSVLLVEETDVPPKKEKNLGIVDLSANNLSSLPPDIKRWTTVRKLDISKNGLKYGLPREMEQMLCKTGRVSGNVSIVFPQSSTSSNS